MCRNSSPAAAFCGDSRDLICATLATSPERFKLWKHGNLPLDKFIPPYPDKRMTVDALKALDKQSFEKGNASVYRASKEAIAFVKENIAKNVDTTGLDTKSLNALSHGLLAQMKKYNLDKFEDFLPGAAGIVGVSRDNKIFMFDA